MKILKKDLRGKSDSLYLDETVGRIELLKRPLSRKEEQVLSIDQKNKRNPVMWFNESQMSGDVIYMKTDFETKKLDSLFIFGNAFIIEKDSLSDNGYNQIVGTELYGDFLDGALNELDVVKNTQVLYYLYSDSGELVGIDKTICSALNITFKENEIEDISFYVSPEGNVFPDTELDPNLRKLEGFLWRKEERPETLEDLFKRLISGVMLLDDFLHYQAKTTPHPMGMVIKRAKGSYIIDQNGKKHLDFVAGVSACSLGHRHPAVIRAIKKQLKRYLHVMVYGEYAQQPAVELCKLLASQLPTSLGVTYLTNSGTEAIEGAMKLAKRVTGREEFVAAQHAYHGSTQGALSLLGVEQQKKVFAPTPKSEIHHL